MLFMKDMDYIEPSDQPKLRRLRNSLQVNVCLYDSMFSIPNL